MRARFIDYAIFSIVEPSLDLLPGLHNPVYKTRLEHRTNVRGRVP
jgi:hypothetical protein